MAMATVAPRKSSGEWLGKRVMAFMREAGLEVEAVVMKTDNEPALVKVVEEVGRMRAAKGGRGLGVENSPVHSSKSNGYIERSVQGVQGMIRTWRSSLEEKWGSEVGRRASDMAVVGGVDRVADVESGGWRGWEDRLREEQGEGGEFARDGVRRGSFVEEEKGRRTAWEVELYVG